MKYIFYAFTFRWVFTLGSMWLGMLIGVCPYSLIWFIKAEIVEIMADSANIETFVKTMEKNYNDFTIVMDLWKDSDPLMTINKRIKNLNSIFLNFSLLDMIRSEGFINTMKFLLWAFSEVKQLKIDQWIVYYNMNEAVNAINREYIQEKLDRLIHSQNTFSWMRDNPVYSYVSNSLSENSTLRYLAYLSIFGSALIVFASLGVNPNSADIIYI